MKIHFELKSDPSQGFRSIKAANSVDLDLTKKLSHVVDLDVDFPADWKIGLIVGSSGSGKTTLAHHLYGKDCFNTVLDASRPVIEQFPPEMSYDDCVSALCSVGLSQVPCWIRPAATLSNGQKFRAEIALQMAKNKEITVIDEWTSVVDRTVAKTMSVCVNKHAKRTQKQIVLCSCHFDVLEWLDPDWVIDCNLQTFRRSLRPFERKERLQFDIREIDRTSWKYFSKYHYLSEKIPGGKVFFYGLFHEDNQIGFQCFANYTPHRAGTKMIMHFNRTVIHPDYVGFGLGQKLIDVTSQMMHDKGYQVMGKFSSISVYKNMINNKKWMLRNEQIMTDYSGGNMKRKSGFRQKQKQWSFLFVP